MAERMGRPALEVRGLNVFHGASHALQGVDLRLGSGVLSVVGRNGMGKTTLCKTIMGLVPAAGGTVLFRGQPVLGRNPAELARMGIGYVPQGRRPWRSLTVDEHLRMVAGRPGPWSIKRISSTFPRLAARKSNSGGQLSGGEQQMLAISRALLHDPRFLVMDEPTEGLAPVIVAQVEEMLLRLADEGEIDVLVIEQNIGVACGVADTVAIMVNGRINRTAPARDLAGDRELLQRLLGVGRHGHDKTPEPQAPPRGATRPRPWRSSICPTPNARPAGRHRCRWTRSNGRPDWSPPPPPRCLRNLTCAPWLPPARKWCWWRARWTPRARNCAISAT